MSGSNSWLNSDALFFDRVADDLMYTHAPIWEAAEPSQDPTSCRHLSPSLTQLFRPVDPTAVDRTKRKNGAPFFRSAVFATITLSSFS
jgi:hypothetical protein